ncbi:MAG: carboxymuconolactone decarboxylase family protein [Clostridia bacterium]|jgi:AhpD family alkylhydroperoxidase|nr:carboxymuconolactone decarboxylase family protein [Clostridia bacterium]
MNIPDCTHSGEQLEICFEKLMPETADIFQKLAQHTFREGALSFKTKELIALGIAVTSRCEDCMNYHLEKLKACGATQAEITEAMEVGFEMGVGLLLSPLRRTLWRHFPDNKG